jgi:hypothetical protein
MILGTGYFLLGSSNGTMTLENSSVNKEQGTENIGQRTGSIAQFESIKDQAQGVKDMVEKRAAETMDQGTENNEQGAGNSEQGAGNKQQTAVAPPAGGTTAPQINIIDRKVDFGFGVSKEKRTIDTIVLHSSYNSNGGDLYSVDKVIDIWRGYGVAPHYLIDRKGTVYRLVDDANIAYHAGVSKMPDGRTNVNDFSIGIEILNTKDDKYTDAQYASVNALIAYLRGKYTIKQVVGHADIAPGRKDDPWQFNWKQLK